MHQFLSLKLNPEQDLKRELQSFCEKNTIQAGCIVSGIGSLKKAKIRLANSSEFFESVSFFEIVSLSGSLSVNGCHIHISIADKDGNIKGGHLVDDNLIYTTAEIVILKLSGQTYEREFDSITGFKELKIT
ncbi:MAG: PPC domain-containing DNA-binding protein [Pseudobdellovibrio sp.]